MKAHLANICPNAPKDMKEYWQESLSNKVIKYKKESETVLDWWFIFDDEDDEIPLVKLTIKLFSIMPSQAGCKRNFSILGWFYGNN
ncbi:21254_t:CDS:2 [Cetraspora pellucida]|uniref:21254_t:CDS:1 n=1 Tax=Cetraspora pellucida TaxID=1433469 RepID=A0A9N9C182_9GLOM|nr:21254_t:CDS:2 [Cetraspora pellucida]